MSSLIRWDPFRGMVRMQRDMDRLFDQLFHRPRALWEAEREEDRIRIPSIDLTETEQEVVLKAELPGVDKDKISVETTGDQITISAEMSKEEEQKGASYHWRERVWGKFERSIPLPVEVLPEQVKASFRDGLLQIRLPKSERARSATPRKVAIE